ncbi:MAG: hypothetical protein ABR519_01145 [Bacteroidales bacterium]
MNKLSTRYLKLSEISVNDNDLIEELFFEAREIERVRNLLLRINAEPTADSVKNILNMV